MAHCKKYRKYLVLEMYQELDDQEQAELNAHLHICEACRLEQANLAQLGQMLEPDPNIPDENSLKVLRNLASIRLKKQRQNEHSWMGFWPRPVLQFMLIVIFVGVGYFAGSRQRSTVELAMDPDQVIRHLISAEQNITFNNSEIKPYLMDIDRLKYDPESGTVSINYNTVNDIRLSADTGDPMVRELLLYALQQGGNPNVRMHAIKAMNAIAAQQRSLEEPYMVTLQKVLEKDDNPGIRLFALRVLDTMPLNEPVKNMLVHVLLYDPNTAMRIEALNRLSREKSLSSEITSYLESAEQDTNEYIRSKSRSLLEQLKQQDKEAKGPYELSRRYQP